MQPGRLDAHGAFAFRRLMARPSVSLLAAFLVIYLLAIRYCHQAYYRDPASYFFDPSRAYHRGYSEARIREADAFVEASKDLTIPQVIPPQAPTVCVGIATVARRGEQYVRRTIGSLLQGLSEEERQSVYLDVLIGHTNPADHPIYNEQWIERLPNKLLKYPEDEGALGRIRDWEKGGWYRNKTIYDYTYLLNDCYETGAQYIAMVEDDTIAMKGWYPRALQALGEVEKAMKRKHDGSEWIYLRLFYVEDLLGWNSEYWPSYLLWSFAFWALITASLVVSRSRSRWLQASLSDSTIATVSLFCFPLLIVLYFLAGKQSMQPLAPGIHEMNKYGCCSQGHIYPRRIVPFLLQKTNLETDWLVDMMVEDIADEEGYLRWVIVPALLQHIGATSSKGYGFDTSARHLWNFGFESHRVSEINH